MAGSKCDYLENALLNGVLGGPQFTLPPTVYIALSTAIYSDTGIGSEVSFTGTAYSRVAVSNTATEWPASVGGSKSNANPITWAAATASWGTVRSFYIMDAPTGGNSLYGADLQTVKTVDTGDTATFGATTVTVTEA